MRAVCGRDVRLYLSAAPLALLLAAGCKPFSDKDQGYDVVVTRPAADEQQIAQATNPPPPPITPGLESSGTAARIQAKNLPAGVTQAMVNEGQDLFGTVCAGCHGPAGAGTPSAPPLNDQKWLWISGTYPEIVNRITIGVPAPKQYPAPMPPRGGGGFSDEQVRKIAAYVYALSQTGGA